MKKLHQLLTLTAAVIAIGLGRPNATAQPNFGNGNFDPQQMLQQVQQRMIESIREQLAVTNDAEWNVIEPKLSKLTQGTVDSMIGQIRNMMGGMGGMGGGPGGAGGNPMLNLGQPNPDAEALQKLLDDHAPTAQIKAALAKYRESVKRKAAELDKAKEDLRQVLSGRQEAVLVAMGLL